MPDLVLRPAEQAALRTLLTIDPVPGRPLPPAKVLETIEELVPCDGMGVGLSDNHGYTLDEVTIHPAFYETWPDPCESGEGPLYLGLMHWGKSPRAAEACGALAGAMDGVAIGYRNGPRHVVQVWFDRVDSAFSRRDFAVLALLNPILQRLLRERPTPRLPLSLTVQERRVLMYVASGHSNMEIADQLFVAPSTVRKHLEHSFRKLGVTSRVAAIARLQGRDLPELDFRERIERFA
jgi:DNA-binding CsgD family transcriptional regulator